MIWHNIQLPPINLYNAPKGTRMATAHDVEKDLHTHEEICALRYETINARLSRLEKILIGMTGGILVLLIHLIIKVAT